jgi:transposase
MGRLPEAWIAPPPTRELRELVRHRAKLVALRSHCKAEVHAVLAKCGVQVSMTDLFGVAGADLLERVELPGVYRGRINSARRLMDSLEFEIDLFTGIVRARLVTDPGYTAVRTIPGIGATHRGRITKQGSRLVRWAAVESVQALPKTRGIGAFRDQVAARRGRNIAVVAAARKQLGHVYYALRDHHVRALGPGQQPKACAA